MATTDVRTLDKSSLTPSPTIHTILSIFTPTTTTLITMTAFLASTPSSTTTSSTDEEKKPEKKSIRSKVSKSFFYAFFACAGLFALLISITLILGVLSWLLDVDLLKPWLKFMRRVARGVDWVVVACWSAIAAVGKTARTMAWRTAWKSVWRGLWRKRTDKVGEADGTEEGEREEKGESAEGSYTPRGYPWKAPVGDDWDRYDC